MAGEAASLGEQEPRLNNRADNIPTGQQYPVTIHI